MISGQRCFEKIRAAFPGQIPYLDTQYKRFLPGTRKVTVDNENRVKSMWGKLKLR